MPAYAQLLVILVAMIGFWAIVMRPARSQQKQVQRLQEQLEVGQEIVLSAGIFGTIRALDGARVEVEVAPGTVLTVARQVVVRRAEEIESTGGAAPDAGTDGDAAGDAGTDGGTDRGNAAGPGAAPQTPQRHED